MDIPEHLLYTKDHEWINIEGDERRSGLRITLKNLGDITFIELPGIGMKWNSSGTLCRSSRSRRPAIFFLPCPAR